MTNPVDTDALNTDRLRSVASTLHSKAFHLMNAAADEVDRLRATIENAPHVPGCRTLVAKWVGGDSACTCWKVGAL